MAVYCQATPGAVQPADLEAVELHYVPGIVRVDVPLGLWFVVAVGLGGPA